MQENYHRQPKQEHYINVEQLSRDQFEAIYKKFNDSAESARKKQQRIKEMEIEYKLMKELIQPNPVLNEMAKQIQVVFNFFDQLSDNPKAKTRKKKISEEEKLQKMIEDQKKKIKLMSLQRLVKQGKINK